MRSLEMDLYRSEALCGRAKHDHVFAQNLYAALCNMRWQHEDNGAEKLWSCSWRHAGDIIATIRQEGDYMDWYCSGAFKEDGEGFVNEGVLVPIIVSTLKEMGWTPVEWE